MDRQTATKHDVQEINPVPENEKQLKRSSKIEDLRSSFQKNLSILNLNQVDIQKYFL